VYHIVLILLAAALSFLAWHLVHYAPSVLSRILPPGLTFGIGAGLLVMGAFGAFVSALGMSPEGILGSFVQVYAGLWFMLATSAGQRGSESDEEMLKRLFAMVGLIMAMVFGTLYVRDQQLVAVIFLLVIASGFWVTTNYLQQLDRSGGRR
jgi:hypothetical protein